MTNNGYITVAKHFESKNIKDLGLDLQFGQEVNAKGGNLWLKTDVHISV